jgi:hypothetical protein
LSFVALAVAWTAGMILAPNMMQPPLTLYLIITLGMFFTKVGKSFWLYSQVDAWEETLIAGILIGSGVWVALTRGAFEPSAMLWAVLLFVQALPFTAALILSMINALPFTRRESAPLPGLALPEAQLGKGR